MTEHLSIGADTIAYDLTGDGPLVVLAHGMGDSRHSYRFIAPALTTAGYRVANVDIRVRVTGGGHTSQIYAIRQAISKSIVAYYQKFVDEHSKNQLKQDLVTFDRTLLVADNRRCEPKKFGGPGARARYQKSYR